MNIHDTLRLLKQNAFLYLINPVKGWRIRNKKNIVVLFYIKDLPKWKTEVLFIHMNKHERFSPIVGIPILNNNTSSVENIIDYCKRKDYKFCVIPEEETIQSVVPADIIMYQEPYEYYIYPKHRMRANKKAAYIYVPYGFHSILEPWVYTEPLIFYGWQLYFENASTLSDAIPYMRTRGKNAKVTGLPIMDELDSASLATPDPWKNNDKKKRIIWAPHHTIGDEHLKGIAYSTFLENCDFMIEIANKYREMIQVAFKPHPVLKSKLITIWGKEKTDDYYRKWEEMPNTQLEEGKYTELFKNSDALIHDCGSFTIEYLYTHNPVMYLTKDKHHCDNMNEFSTKAFNLHYLGGLMKTLRNSY